MVTAADDLGLDCLVEVHDVTELAKALEANAILIGINNRNLNDFSVSLETSVSLAKRIPEGVIAVSESGINSQADIRMLRDAGYSSFLIGEALVRAADPVTLLTQLRSS
jgi:indole-3-glycerol phosphate synthase